MEKQLVDAERERNALRLANDKLQGNADDAERLRKQMLQLQGNLADAGNKLKALEGQN
jgi:hypothetical protein